MGFKIGVLEIDTDYSSSETSLASSSSDEQKKMNKKAAKGKDHKYRAEKVPAYESVIGPPTYRKKGEERKKTRFLPPPAAAVVKEAKATPIEVPTIAKLDEAEVRAALLKHVNSQACWRSDAAEKMSISNLKMTNAFVYRCEMFVEVRKVKWVSQGYKKGDSIDPPAAGAAPMPWDLEMQPKQQWKEEKRKAEVPHTASVRKCWYCKGKGQVRCRDCKGQAHFPCSNCDGGGTVAGPEGDVACFACGGSGHRACLRCHGAGKYKCKTCSGHKKLKWSVRNQTKWEAHSEDKIHEETALPDQLVSEVKGQEMYKDEGQLLAPLTEFPEQCIVKFSKELLPAMAAKYSKEGRILAMRHTVLATPVTEVDWKHEDQGGKFFVYGLDQRVYFPDYPQQCCCSLL